MANRSRLGMGIGGDDGNGGMSVADDICPRGGKHGQYGNVSQRRIFDGVWSVIASCGSCTLQVRGLRGVVAWWSG